MYDDRYSCIETPAAPIAAALERAAGTIARLDSALASHPLAPAWAWRTRLDAVRRQAAIDGKAIDPWRLAALIEGVRFRLDHIPAMIERGILFAAARHALRTLSMVCPARQGATGRDQRGGGPSRGGRRRRNRRCSAPHLRSMPGSIRAASGRRSAPRWFGIGCGAG